MSAVEAGGTMPSAATLAREVLGAMRTASQIAPFSRRVPDFGLPEGYAVAAELHAIWQKQPVGRKIGFTNRTIWERYGVSAPMWGVMTTDTVTPIGDGPFAVAPFCQPRLEPEVALKLARPPEAGMDEAELADCIEWFAPAFEIVHSIFPDWSFALSDCAAANGLHGQLLLGPPLETGAFALELPAISLELRRNSALVETGAGENVLGGPLSALRHLVETLSRDGGKPLATGELITTGTLTDAWPISPGDTFHATYKGSPLSTIRASFI